MTSNPGNIAEFNRRLTASDKLDPQEILSIIKQLKKEQISRAVLKSTRIGQTVNSFKSHSDPAVSEASSELVEIWKSAVAAARAAKSGTTSTGTSGAGDTGASANDGAGPQRSDSSNSVNETNSVNGRKGATPRATSGHSGGGGGSVGSDDNDAEAPAVPFEYVARPDRQTDDDKREKCRTLLFKAFEEGCSAVCRSDAARLSVLIDELEEAMFSHHAIAQRDVDSYWTQVRTLKSNLRDKNNTSFNEKLYFGDFDAKDVAKMTSRQMASEEKKRERETQLREATDACQSDWDIRNVKRSKGEFTCPKCRSQDTSYNQLQTRSSDEPMTTFVVCLNCKKRWKF
eukprot:Selendium_serpulae@DN3880_c0_g1_i1.p1